MGSKRMKDEEPFGCERFVEKQLNLVEVEHQAEVEENRRCQDTLPLSELLRRGVCINKLRLASSRTGLYGRTVVTLEPNPVVGAKDRPLPAHNISSGDILGIGAGSFERKELLASGVVTSVRRSELTIAFDEDVSSLGDNDSTQFYVIKVANNVTHRRLKSALNNLRKYPANGRSIDLVDVLFGQKSIGEPLTAFGGKDIELFNKNLNDSQRDAIDFALKQREVAIIHGPPGTGKTTTVIEFILQAVLKYDLKVLACAPSNVAVDNMVEKLVEAKFTSLVRLGHPARALPEIQKYSLDAVLTKSDQHQLVDDIRSEIDAIKKRSRGSKYQRGDIGSLMKELRQREKRAFTETLKGSKVVLSTLTSASSEGPLKNLIYNNDPADLFDVVVIDECSQALEASCWIPLTFAPKCVLAGDHLQLPPTIISKKAAKDGLQFTLMERLLKQYPGESLMRMLTVQYRMNEKIMHWPSDKLYDNRLVAHESVATHTLTDIVPSVSYPPLLLIDTTGCDMFELDVEDEESKGNEGEADIVAAYVESLISHGISPSIIGVITPYNLQVELIRLRLKSKYPSLEIKSVDGFQGREKEVVILSLVRSNGRREVGFLGEHRRINVAVTRAKRHLAVICDSETVSNDPYIRSLIEYMSSDGEVKSAHEFNDQISLFNDIERPQHLRFKFEGKKSKKDKEKEQDDRDNVKTKYSAPGAKKLPVRDPKFDEERKEKIKKQVEQFLKSDELVLSFPSAFSSFERKLVHDVAEEFNLIHESVGEDAERKIMVKKVSEEKGQLLETVREAEVGEPETVSAEASADIIPAPEVEAGVSVKPKKPRRKPAKKQSQNTKQPKPVAPVEPKVESKPKLVRPDKLRENLEKADEGDFDAMIAAVQKADNICAFMRCKTSVIVLGLRCDFCNRRFCLSHSIPEAHGCGAEAKIHARRMISKEGKLYPGSGVPDHKGDPVKRVHLARKLNKALDKMSLQRKPQKKEDN